LSQASRISGDHWLLWSSMYSLNSWNFL
jgi:hypothetical protein